MPESVESAVEDEPASPIIVGKDRTSPEKTLASPRPSEHTNKSIPARYFILKSLTLEDLEASLTTCNWATQPHNEQVLDKAYAESQDVFLIFSANKSGNYFGYARMTSPINSEASKADSEATTAGTVANDASDGPRTIRTAPTSTAPAGLIIDDSARGSIFWEADRSQQAPSSPNNRGNDGKRPANGHFSIQWISTTKLPFYLTRGMRNPYNDNREIKIARDGQELDPRVGRRLVQLFRVSAQPRAVDGVSERADG